MLRAACSEGKKKKKKQLLMNSLMIPNPGISYIDLIQGLLHNVSKI